MLRTTHVIKFGSTVLNPTQELLLALYVCFPPPPQKINVLFIVTAAMIDYLTGSSQILTQMP